MKHVHFDIDEIKRRVDQAMAVNDSMLNDPGVMGAQCRLMRAALGAFTLACIEEANRETSHDDLQGAVAALITNMAMSWVDSTIGLGRPPDERLAQLNELMADVSVCVSEILREPHGTSIPLPTVQAGTA